MTEEEAKTKMCCGPQTVAMVIGLAAPNLTAEITEDAGRCIASACMAWRWLPAPEIKSKLQAIKEYRDQHGTDLVTSKNAVEAAWTPPVPTQGFCGLAGAQS